MLNRVVWLSLFMICHYPFLSFGHIQTSLFPLIAGRQRFCQKGSEQRPSGFCHFCYFQVLVRQNVWLGGWNCQRLSRHSQPQEALYWWVSFLAGVGWRVEEEGWVVFGMNRSCHIQDNIELTFVSSFQYDLYLISYQRCLGYRWFWDFRAQHLGTAPHQLH